MYIVLRVDRRFHIPDGSRGAGSYSLRTKQEEIDLDSSSSGGVHRVFSEEETFDDARQAQSMPKRREEETSVERLT